MTVDSSDNVILTGRFIGTADFGTGTPKTASTIFNSFVLKLGSNGDAQWVHTNYFSGASPNISNLDDSPTAVDTDSNGNIYVTGRFDGHYGQDSYLNIGSYAIDLTQITYGEYFIKINPSGVVQWVYITDDVAPARGQEVFVDTQDNIYLAGKCNLTTTGTATLEKVGGSDIFSMDCSGTSSIKFSWVYVAKLDSSGEYIWHWMSKSWDGVPTLSVAGDTGDVYVAYNTFRGGEGMEGFYNQQEICGTTLQPAISQDERHLMLVKLNSAGTCQWFYREEPRDNGAVSMVMDSNNNLYLQHKPGYIIGRTLERFSPQGVQTSYTHADNMNIYDFVIDTEDNIYTLSNYVKADASTGQYWPGVSKRTLSDLVIN
jgi:hypothetical protein